MFKVSLRHEENGYTEPRTFIDFEVRQLNAMQVQEELQEYFNRKGTEVLHKIENGEIITFYGEGGAANVRVSEQGWTIFLKDLNQLPTIKLTLPGCNSITEIEGLDDDPLDIWEDE